MVVIGDAFRLGVQTTITLLTTVKHVTSTFPTRDPLTLLTTRDEDVDFKKEVLLLVWLLREAVGVVTCSFSHSTFFKLS